MILSGWGNFPRVETETAAARSLEALRTEASKGGAIARGAGRAYGDSAIGRERTIDMRRFNRMLSFDAEHGRLEAEAGVMLRDIISVFLPRGWFPAVTPGTKFVTLGGMIAADVHGKNHHRDGSMRAFVDWIDLLGPDGELRRCSRDAHAELFDWTIGGMGLTGVIMRAAIRLRRVETAWIRQDLRPAHDLEAAMRIFEENPESAYSVAWIDCSTSGEKLGRSLVMLGEHARLSELPPEKAREPLTAPRKRTVGFPFHAPGFLLNRISIGAFNEIYFRNGLRRAGVSLIDWDSYFYPLDSILDWNRMYGRAGFAQFQCVTPADRSLAALRSMLALIANSGQGSFLSVLKRFGPEGGGLSFPMEGYTLALDFPVHAKSLALMNELDRIVLDHGGRFYLAKDSRMSAETFARSERRLGGFSKIRDHRAFASAQSERLKF